MHSFMQALLEAQAEQLRFTCAAIVAQQSTVGKLWRLLWPLPVLQ
jgi:hypothetical protein